MNDPIRQWHAGRLHRAYKLPDPPPDPPRPVDVESLTPGASITREPDTDDVMRRFMLDVRNGVYGS